MGQNATQRLLRSPQLAKAPAPGFVEFFSGRAAPALARALGMDVAIGLHRETRPQDATLRAQLSRPQLVAALPQPSGHSAFLFVPDSLARQVVAARLGAPLDDKPLSAIDLALGGVLGEAAQLALSLWRPCRALPAGPLGAAPLDAGDKTSWLACEFTIAIGRFRPCRLRLVLPASLAKPPAPPPPRPLPARTISPAALASALQGAPLPLRAVLHRLVVDSATLGALRQGDVLPLPAGCLNALVVELGTAAATPIARGRLGAFDGQKVLKLTCPPDASQLRLAP